MTNSATVSLSQRVQHAGNNIRRYLDRLGNRKLRWLLPDHPVRTKNLEKIVGHLQTMLLILPTDDDPRLACLLEQLERPERMAFDSAWEVADLLELEILRLADDPRLHMLLTAQQAAGADGAHRWERHFPTTYLETLLGDYNGGRFQQDHLRVEARRALEYIHQARIAEYRVDRAKARLRGIYLSTMALLLGGLIAAMSYFYLASMGEPDRRSTTYLTKALLLTILSGAAGSVLSRAVKLGKQPLHAEPDTNAPEPPLGIRALLSGWKVFFAQPVLGATAALVVFLVFSAGLIQLGDGGELGPAGVALVGFLAGFSEPFFLGVLDKVGGKGERSPG